MRLSLILAPILYSTLALLEVDFDQKIHEGKLYTPNTDKKENKISLIY